MSDHTICRKCGKKHDVSKTTSFISKREFIHRLWICFECSEVLEQVIKTWLKEPAK